MLSPTTAVTREVPTEGGRPAGSRLAYWDADSRLALRKEAEAANAAVELRPCQQVKDFRLRHKIASPVVKPAAPKS